MTKVSSISDIKKAIQHKESVLIPTNKKTRFILLATTKLPHAVFAANATSSVITTGAASAVSATVALTGTQIWAIIGIAGLLLIIGILRANRARIKFNPQTGDFEVEYDSMK